MIIGEDKETEDQRERRKEKRIGGREEIRDGGVSRERDNV